MTLNIITFILARWRFEWCHWYRYWWGQSIHKLKSCRQLDVGYRHRRRYSYAFMALEGAGLLL